MAITAKDVNELRQQTGLGMMECKKALEETAGDRQAAMDLLRKKGLAKMAERADRASSEGRIAAVVAPDRSRAAIVKINTETDFTAGNDAFKAMAVSVASEALKQSAPGSVLPTPAIQKLIDDVKLTTKENVQFGSGLVVGGPGSVVGAYVHFTGKTGALIELTGDGSTITEDLLKDLCQHVVAISPAPLAVSDDQVPAEVVAKEREIARAQALESGKPPQIADKMVEGKIRKFYEEVVLTKQLFVKDDKKKISDILPKGAAIKSFVRFTMSS